MKLCSDCRHFRPFSHTQDDGHCAHPELVWLHPVSGVKRHPLAFSQRTSISRNSCGIGASFWDYDPGAPPEPSSDEGEQL